MKQLQKFYPHLLAILGFIVIALIYFYPVLQGKKIYQSDIVQYTGMAKEQNDFRKEFNEEPYWTNSAFGGMPTYQLGANYPHNYVKKIDSILRFLPRPADYLFLYFLGFYVLLMVLKIDPLKAFFGALAFGFSTYLIIILGVGHNAKAHAIAYMPIVLAGVLLVFQRKFLFGGILTMIAAALEIQANHFQMTYYLLLLLLVVTIFYVVQFAKEKAFKDLAKAFGVFAIAGILAIGAAKFGALDIDAVDIDPAAVVATQDNANVNQVQLNAGLPDVAKGQYQTVLANILATPLKVLAPLLCGHVAPGGYLVLAGILDRQEQELKDAYAPYCQLQVSDSQEGWILMTAQISV
mgnify:CR=1 FL=1